LFFPAPNNPGKPLDEQRALDWLRKSEKLAGLESIKGGGFHCLRRKWGCERKDLARGMLPKWAGGATRRRS
jgi:hypothetical protein